MVVCFCNLVIHLHFFPFCNILVASGSSQEFCHNTALNLSHRGDLFLSSAFTQSNVNPNLPGHNDTFQSIRANKNVVYVDKSDYITKLLESEHRFYSMCRPGRFGKSNFLQMLRAFFSGEKQLFEGLAVYTKHDWRKSYPVIYLDFSAMDISSWYTLHASLNEAIIQTGRAYGIEIDKNLPLYPDELQDFHKEYCGHNDSKMGLLVHHLSDGGRVEQSVVVLIDEYDWPQQSYSPRYTLIKIRERTIFENLLNPFFHQFERMKRYIKFLFMTCTSISSYRGQMRNEYPTSPIALQDLTFDPRFSQMIGLTGEELKSNFQPHIEATISHQSPQENFDSVVQQLKTRYNGYCFLRENVSAESECRLYNFHSVMTCLRDQNLDYLWHPAGDPKYNIIDDYPVSDLWTAEKAMRYASRRVSADSFFSVSRNQLEESNYNVTNKIPINVCMVLHGYLTLRGYDQQSDNFLLAFPNEEMRLSFRKGVLKFLLGRDISQEEFFETCKSLRVSTLVGEAKNFLDTLDTLAFRIEEKEVHMYSQKYPKMKYSPERIVDIFRTCDLSLRENTTGENDGFKIELYDEYKIGGRVDSYEYFGLKMELSDQAECWIRFEFGKSASSAMNVLLKEIGGRGEQQLRSRTIHLMGINVHNQTSPIEDWIWITYTDGKFNNLQASHPRYSAMYNAYVSNVLPKLKTQ